MKKIITFIVLIFVLILAKAWLYPYDFDASALIEDVVLSIPEL